MPYDRSDSGALFVNDKKGNPKAPDRKGPIDIVCPHCRKAFRREMAGWLREAKDGGQKFLSVKLSEPRGRAQREEQGDESF